MGVIQRDGFKFFDGLNKDYLVVESSKIKMYMEYINQNQIDSIAIHEDYYRKADLSFMKNCPHVSKVNILSPDITDFSGLNNLHGLKELYFGNPKSKVDVSTFPYLTHLYADFNKNVLGLEKCHTLKVLKLWNYKPVSSGLTDLCELSELEELELIKSGISDLKGMDKFESLLKLGLYNCTKLEDIDGLRLPVSGVTELTIESCKKLFDFRVIENLKKLEKLWLTDNGDITTISFISNLNNLESFVFMGTTVLDGNLHACANLKYVAFTDKKHYSHKFKDFQKS